MNNVADRIQTEMTADPNKEELDLVMCPYYGNGVKDTKRLEAFMSSRTVNKNRINLAVNLHFLNNSSLSNLPQGLQSTELP